MKFFVDTANLDQIREAHAMGVLDGVTTNPSLMARENIRGEEACRRAALTEDQQVFLLGHKYETDFEKDTSGGLLTKRYFWGVPDKCSSAEELACMIRGKRWSDWKCKEGC